MPNILRKEMYLIHLLVSRHAVFSPLLAYS